jgi:hypothetical protein
MALSTMPPQEKATLLVRDNVADDAEVVGRNGGHRPLLMQQRSSSKYDSFSSSPDEPRVRHDAASKYACGCAALVALTLVVVFTLGATVVVSFRRRQRHFHHEVKLKNGTYHLVELQKGDSFLSYYDFYNGADSVGSAGYNVYVDQERAQQLGLIQINGSVTMRSATVSQGPRESIRLEGKNRYNAGLFIVNVDHVPTGCGVWPALWFTDEAMWPNHGEIDLIESINTQQVAKTALHASESCTMYGTVPPWAKTGSWDTAELIPNQYTGIPDNYTRTVADDCWVNAPHQWANQGCVMSDTNNPQPSIGPGFNANGGGIYVLEWDPVRGYIRSWVFGRNQDIPANLQDSIATAAMNHGQRSSKKSSTLPDPTTWDVLPYAYFAIGNGTRCSSDHFANMRMVLNLAFCGNVAGNRFARDCPELAQKFATHNNSDPIAACNAYIASNPSALDEAYWKIQDILIYQRL